MRLAMYKPARERTSEWRIGAAVDDFMLDLEAAARAYNKEHAPVAISANILDLLRRGDEAIADVRRVHDWATGSGMVGAGRLIFPHESPWYLLPGDVIECEVERVGLLRNRIVEDESGPASWDWAP